MTIFRVKNLFLLGMLFLTASVFSLSGCHTVKGVGQDLEQGGEALQKASKEK